MHSALTAKTKLCNVLLSRRTNVESETNRDAFATSCPQAGAGGIAADAGAAGETTLGHGVPTRIKAGSAQGVLLFQRDVAELAFALGLARGLLQFFWRKSPSPYPLPHWGRGNKN